MTQGAISISARPCVTVSLRAPPPGVAATAATTRRASGTTTGVAAPSERLTLRADLAGCPGRAVQVDPIKPTLKAPGTKCLKLKDDDLLSNCAFSFNSRRYTPGAPRPAACGGAASKATWRAALCSTRRRTPRSTRPC
jgi:hypothetical protein